MTARTRPEKHVAPDVDDVELEDEAVPEGETDSARADDDGVLDRLLGAQGAGEVTFRVEVGDSVYNGRGPRAEVGALLTGLGDLLRYG